ncbi:U-actitoxin-Avd3m [Bulinus truncatus]|nr:U-actitoxin-Avd3m [Bulinus truncatus]
MTLQESFTRHSPQTLQPSNQVNRLHKLLKMMTKFVVLCLVATLCIQLSTQQDGKLNKCSVNFNFRITVDCTLPAVVGPCKGMENRFFYNTATGACEHFFFGGCQGNSNNFFSVEECNTACVKTRK